MQMRSSDSVRITYLDKPGIMKAIRSLAEELSQKYPEIEEISVFGSFARDEAVPGSDVDILIVLADSQLSFGDRIMSGRRLRGLAGERLSVTKPLSPDPRTRRSRERKYMPSYFPIGVELFPYTRCEIKRMLSQGNYFLKSAIHDSILLFSK